MKRKNVLVLVVLVTITSILALLTLFIVLNRPPLRTEFICPYTFAFSVSCQICARNERAYNPLYMYSESVVVELFFHPGMSMDELFEIYLAHSPPWRCVECFDFFWQDKLQWAIRQDILKSEEIPD